LRDRQPAAPSLCKQPASRSRPIAYLRQLVNQGNYRRLPAAVAAATMCVLDGSSTLQDWLVWDKHPIRKQYDVVMDLGECRAAITCDATMQCFPTYQLESIRQAN
jgi:hypothetical protein